MKKYICTICGYVYDEAKNGPWEELPADWKCPVCGADKGAFRAEEEPAAIAPSAPAVAAARPREERELSAMEMSVICSNLARGCEKQYLAPQAESFQKLAAFFRRQAPAAPVADMSMILERLDEDLTAGYPYANAVASEQRDRGALRSLVWSEKVTRMLQSLLNRYRAEGDRMLENTGVYVCTICGFISVGDNPPALCPVCKVPSWKFEKVERRA